MPKPARVIRPVKKNLSLPEDVVAPVELLLWSELESRVPHGAFSELVTRLLRDWLTQGRAALNTQGQTP